MKMAVQREGSDSEATEEVAQRRYMASTRRRKLRVEADQRIRSGPDKRQLREKAEKRQLSEAGSSAKRWLNGSVKN